MELTTSTTTDLSNLSPVTLAALAALDHDLQKEVLDWHAALLPIQLDKRKRGENLGAIAALFKVSPKTARKKFDRFCKYGVAGLINRRAAGSEFWTTEEPVGLSIQDKEELRRWCETYQRNNKAAIREMRRQWKLGSIATDTALNPETGYPRGWTERNLARHAPDEISLAAARQGRSATDAYRSLTYTTRRELYVGQYYLFDDIWHDHYCNLLATRQTGRPLEFHGLDLASAYKMCWGMRLRREVADEKNGGTKMESLKTEDFRFLLASFLFTHGYNPRGTTLVVEHATTAIDERVEQLLAIASGGLIKVERGGMVGAAAHAGQYAGRAKGNFRIKAALESLGNLIHNEFAALPGQTGKDRQHAPEQLHGLLKHNDALLWALSKITPERAQWLQWDFCTLQQFQLIAQEVYARINAREDHNLEGWDERYVPDRYTGKMRRMSPYEVWTPGARHLRPIGPEIAAMIIGKDGGKERPVRKGEIAMTNSEISGDPLRFDAHHLPPRATYLCVLNPFDTKRLTLFDAKGGYVTTLNRIDVPSRDDMEALQRSTGRAEKALNDMLLPMRRRAMKQARAKRDRHNFNAQVIDTSRPFTAAEKLEADERRALTVPITDFMTENGEDPYAPSDVPAHAADPFAADPNDRDEHVDSGDDDAPVVIASMEDFI
jgi:hypothetical protein